MAEEKNNFLYTSYRKFIAQKNLESTGVQNGGTQPYLRNFLVLKQVLVSCFVIQITTFSLKHLEMLHGLRGKIYYC